jgi:2-keto-4-pentenoate hydratase/2-oxohepta-3-ene-1,7-dioic acid hydratase in catechol pathway
MELPIDRPQKIVCVGLNYRDHAEEQGTELNVGEPLVPPRAPSLRAGPAARTEAEPAEARQIPESPLACRTSRRAKPGSGSGSRSLSEPVGA